MYKIVIIFSLVLLLIGIAAFGWVLVQQQRNELLQPEKNAQLTEQLMELNLSRIDDSDTFYAPESFTDQALEQQLAKHHKQNEINELIFSVSIAFIAIGGTISIGSLILKIIKVLLVRCPCIKKIFLRIKKEKNDTGDQNPEIDTEINKGISGPMHKRPKQKTPSAPPPEIVDSPLRYDYRPKDAEEIGKLYRREKSLRSQASSKVALKAPDTDSEPFDQLANDIRKTILSDYHQNSIKLEDSFKYQTENLKKQITQSVREATLEHSNPINNTIEELACEISSIRQYASLQQEKIENFQGRHDWKVIKSFCLRTIRVIDNIQKRIQLLSQNDVETSDLEEISDELIFALESSSVERYEPDINSEYRGQEKLAEAIKDKEHSEDANRKGRIAKVIRAGYQYVIDENNVKIIRPAQVKLYG